MKIQPFTYLRQITVCIRNERAFYCTFASLRNLKSPMLQRFSSSQFNHVSQTYPPFLQVSPSDWVCLLIYYSNSPVSTGGGLLHRDHLMIDGSPEVTQDWGAKEMLSIQQTSWNQHDAAEIVFNSEEGVVKEHESCLPRWSFDVAEIAFVAFIIRVKRFRSN